MGLQLEKASIQDLGRAETLRVSKGNTTIIDGAGSAELIHSRVFKLAGGVAVIKVGASTETDQPPLAGCRGEPATN